MRGSKRGMEYSRAFQQATTTELDACACTPCLQGPNALPAQSIMLPPAADPGRIVTASTIHAIATSKPPTSPASAAIKEAEDEGAGVNPSPYGERGGSHRPGSKWAC